ncbi:unnamed protein product [Callosobruchus maculatus]|uniref:Uncharacterized protein n=1 Tax=Callosobruchus maculatus TaxID=64391 RepID=A0A653CQG7_CALMS|nr:unnamed protein product [Callosobruchus maculatus]
MEKRGIKVYPSIIRGSPSKD